MRRWFAVLGACLMWEAGVAACALAQAAGPFPELPAEPPTPSAYGWAYASMASGVALMGSSFLIGDRADDTYDAYLRSTDPRRIDELFDRTVLYDRLAQGTLISGELLVATGLYLRFIHHPKPTRVAFVATPTRCALTYRL